MKAATSFNASTGATPRYYERSIAITRFAGGTVAQEPFSLQPVAAPLTSATMGNKAGQKLSLQA